MTANAQRAEVATSTGVVGDWYLQVQGNQTTLYRHSPWRFDFCAQTVLPDGCPKRIAHQVRQDIWRALQNVRGFSPVVQITNSEDGLLVKAGGRIMGRISPKLLEKVSAVLENPKNRARWVRCAGGLK